MKQKTSFLKKFKSLDVFGLGISFTIQGSDKSRSVFGAIISLLCTVLVSAYMMYQFQLMVRY